ncbi:MAG: hypothetical protein ACI906_000947 [Candidatus Latescibacterota bacterium]|jgi:hypothetical protein
MSVTLDIESAEKTILEEGETAECKGLMPNRNTFEAGDANGVLQSDMPSGATINGERSMAVQGSLNGTQSDPCRVQVKGDLVVTGNIYHAQIRCRKLYAGGDVQHSRIIAVEDVQINGELMVSQLSTGDYSDKKQYIDNCHRDYAKGQEDRESLERQIRQEEKRVDRSCKATRIPLDFNISRIMTHENNQVRINLSSFYTSLGELPEDKRKLALMEFFAKGIVGYLARANRKYIDGNPAREKVFLQLLRHLRELFQLVAERDFLARRQKIDQEQLEEMIEKLRNQQQAIYVQGGVQSENTIRFALPRVRSLGEGQFEFIDHAATLKVSAAAGDELHLELVDTEGNKEVRNVGSEDLEDLRFQTSLGKVVWNTVTTQV